jgi:Tol biopolymer transport system component
MNRVVAILLAAGSLVVATAFAAEESWIARLLRVTGLTASPARMRGSASDDISGDVWLVDVDGKHPKALTRGGRFRSPVFSPDGTSLYLLRNDVVMKIPVAGGSPSQVLAVPGATRIIGFQRDNADEVLMLVDNAAAPIGAVSLSRKAYRPLAFDGSLEGADDMLAQIRGETRTYGRIRLLVRTQSRRASGGTIEWTDIYVQDDEGAPRQVSSCNGRQCRQPALSADRASVAFIQQMSAGSRAKE